MFGGAMSIGSWNSPVSVHAGRHGSTRCLVGDTMRAAEILTSHWPSHAFRGPKYTAACRACRDVLVGDAAPEIARQAFIEAAEEADILAR